MPTRYSNVRLDAYVIMFNQVHAIVILERPPSIHSGRDDP